MEAMAVIWNAVLSLVGFMAIWIFRNIFEQLRDLSQANAANLEKIKNLESEQGRHDERGKSLKEQLDAIFAILREIDNKLDRKVDKTECDRSMNQACK